MQHKSCGPLKLFIIIRLMSEIIKRIIKSDSSNKYSNHFCALNEALIKAI